MIGLSVLLGTAAALLAGSALTARRTPGPVPDLEGYLRRWSGLHHGYDPHGSLAARALLTATYALARPVSRWGVKPDALTLWTLWFACAALVAAHAGGRWPAVAAAMLALSGLGDALDGAVAAMTDRVTPWGSVFDSVVDRVNDAIYLVAVWVVGAPAGLAVFCGVALGLLEYLRARAGNAGMAEIGVVTVGERPVRVILCTAALVVAGVAVDRAAAGATLALGVLALLSAVAVVQLAVAVRRSLAGVASGPPVRGSGGTDQVRDDSR